MARQGESNGGREGAESGDCRNEGAATVVVVAAVAVAPDCCVEASDYCSHTTIEHNGHVSTLVDGTLFRRVDGAMLPHALEHTPWCSSGASPHDEERCRRVDSLEGHLHGPGCGHEAVPHGDHVDYLVHDRLHHVVQGPSCCGRGCHVSVDDNDNDHHQRPQHPQRRQLIVDHGKLKVLVHKRFNPEAQNSLPEVPPPPSTETQSRGSSTGDLREPLLEVVTSSQCDALQPSSPRTSKIHCEGICCPSEVPIIHRVLEPLPGVSDVKVNVVLKTVTVAHEHSSTSPGALVDALNGARLQAALVVNARGAGAANGGPWHRRLPPWYLLVSGFCGVAAFCHYVPGWEALRWAGLGSVALGAGPVALRAAAALRNGLLDVNVLMLVATAGAAALQNFEEAGAIVFLFALSEWLEAQAMRRAQLAVEELVDLKQETAALASSGASVPASRVLRGMHLLVRPGDRFPVDGVVSRGSSLVDESMLTGESRPVPKRRLGKVMSGTVNAGRAALEVEAAATSKDSSAAVLARLVEQASLERSSTERFVQTFAKWYTPIVILSALLIAVVPLAMRDPQANYYVYLSLVLLVTACPCALVISTPVAAVCGLARGAQEGILIKGGQHLESLSAVKVVTLDKTGTLTEGNFTVESAQVLSGAGVMTEERLLMLASSVEAQSPHPLAPAVVAFAGSRGISPSHNVTEIVNLEGKGVAAKVDGVSVFVGNRHVVEELSPGDAALMMLHDEHRDDEDASSGGTVCWVGASGRLVGRLTLSDRVRPNARAAVSSLRAMGVHPVMLTGDNEPAAMAVAEQVGIPASDVGAALLPHQKLERVRSYKAGRGALAHVGDGINDAPALAAADVGIAMGVSGAAAAVEAADVALFTTDLRKLATAVSLSKAVRRTVMVNIAVSVVVKAAVLGSTLLGYPSLLVAIVSDVGTALVVVLNSCGLLAWRKNVLLGRGKSQCQFAESHQAEEGAASGTYAAPSPCCASGSCGVAAKEEPKPSSSSSSSSCCPSKSSCCSAKEPEPKAPCCGPIKSSCCGAVPKEAHQQPQVPTTGCTPKASCCGASKAKEPEPKAPSCCSSKAPEPKPSVSSCSSKSCCAPKDPEPKPSSSSKPCCSSKNPEPNTSSCASKSCCDPKASDSEPKPSSSSCSSKPCCASKNPEPKPSSCASKPCCAPKHPEPKTPPSCASKSCCAPTASEPKPSSSSCSSKPCCGSSKQTSAEPQPSCSSQDPGFSWSNKASKKTADESGKKP